MYRAQALPSTRNAKLPVQRYAESTILHPGSLARWCLNTRKKRGSVTTGSSPDGRRCPGTSCQPGLGAEPPSSESRYAVRPSSTWLSHASSGGSIGMERGRAAQHGRRDRRMPDRRHGNQRAPVPPEQLVAHCGADRASRVRTVGLQGVGNHRPSRGITSKRMIYGWVHTCLTNDPTGEIPEMAARWLRSV